MIDGLEINLGGTLHMVPPMNFKILKTVQPLLEELNDMKGVPNGKHIDTICKIIWLAMKRNYPEMTLDFVESSVDMGNFVTIMHQVLSAAGIKGKSTGEA